MKKHTFDYSDYDMAAIKAAIDQGGWNVDSEDEDQIRETEFQIYEDDIPGVFRSEYLQENLISNDAIAGLVDESQLRNLLSENHEEVEVAGITYTVVYVNG